MPGRSEAKLKDTPGPGQYSPNTKPTKKAAPAYVTGTEVRKSKAVEILNHNPGPGTYKLNSSFGKTNTGFGFGSASRDPLRKGGSPGPGAYKVPTKIAET